jgi:uncharacterized protein YutE (UPF0331/DUF86 family)
MTGRAAVTRRLLVLSETLRHLARPDAGDAARLAADLVLRAAVERWLQVAIEACIDLAEHVCADREWTPPGTARGAFAALAAHGLMDVELAHQLGRAAAIRNLLVHDYADVDVEVLARVVREDLADLRTFARMAASWMAPTG